jgi:hypothetical protein
MKENEYCLVIAITLLVWIKRRGLCQMIDGLIEGYINHSEHTYRQWAIVLGDSFRVLDACSLLTGFEVH